MHAVFLLAALVLTQTCGEQDGDKSVGEPCTREEECADGLLCRGGVCYSPFDGGGDAG